MTTDVLELLKLQDRVVWRKDLPHDEGVRLCVAGYGDGPYLVHSFKDGPEHFNMRLVVLRWVDGPVVRNSWGQIAYFPEIWLEKYEEGSP